MTAFQFIVAPLAVVLALRSVVGLLRGERPRWAGLLRAAIWTIAAVAVLRPDLTTVVANSFGIGRGADLVMYVVAIAFVAGFFFLYARYRRVEASLTALTRYLALRDAQPPVSIGAETPPTPLERNQSQPDADARS